MTKIGHPCHNFRDFGLKSAKNSDFWPKMGPGTLNEKSNRPPFLELCSTWEAQFWYVAWPWGDLKKWCGIFKYFEFSGPKMHYVRFKMSKMVILKHT